MHGYKWLINCTRTRKAVRDLGFEVCQTALIEVEAARARDEIVFSEIVPWIR